MTITVKGYSPDLDSPYTLTWDAGRLTPSPIANLVRLYVGDPAYLPPHGPSRTLSLADPLSIIYFLQARTQVHSATGLPTFSSTTVTSAVTNLLVQKAVTRHVRTPAGEKKFSQPVGSVIVRDIYHHRPRKDHTPSPSSPDDFSAESPSRITPTAPLTPLQTKNRAAWLALHQIDAETLQANTRQLLDEAGPDAASYGESWYFNAHLYARQYAEDYSIPVSTAAAIIARLSPRNKWYVPGALNKDGRDMDAEGRGNLANARIIIEAVRALDDPAERERRIEITGAMFDKNRAKLGSSKNLVPASRRAAIADQPDGTRLGDLTPAELALFHPEIMKGDALPSNSAPALRIAFGELTPDKGLGAEAKVRSFYNNILAPGADDSVTIDTHQTRAMMLKIDYPESAYGAIAKVGPRYQFFADQVRTVAAERGLHPHQVQAIMWEQWRVDNPPAKRREATRALLSLPQHDALDKDGAPKIDDKGNVVRVVDYKVGDAVYEVLVKKLEAEQRALEREVATEQKKVQQAERKRAKEAKASQARRDASSSVTLTGGGGTFP
jgi:hypothetical protein